MIYKNIVAELEGLANPKRAEGAMRFFKTGKGQYGEGDVFLGITMPRLREFCIGVGFPNPGAGTARGEETSPLHWETVEKLLQNKYHEVRMVGILLLVGLAKNEPKNAFEMYVKNTGVGKGVNNWDLIDVATHLLVGPYLDDKKFVEACIKSPDLWVNRMVVVATLFEIRKGEAGRILEIAPQFLTHKHDLMHKAVGWMLREMGKKCGEKYLIEFLEKYFKQMPRTMLRYSIERLGKKDKDRFMKI